MGAIWYALSFTVLAPLLMRAVHFVIRREMRNVTNPTAGSSLAQFLQAMIVVGALILYARVVPALRSVGAALLTGGSVGAVVLGLAAQRTLGNLITGFSIPLYHAFRARTPCPKASCAPRSTG